MAVITLLTDFGDKDYYVGLFKGDLHSATPSSRIVDISHSIPPYDIVTGAFFLKNTFEHFPKGTIHIVRVYEQGLGKQKLLAAKYRNYYFIAPDNGILSLVFEEKPDLVVEVDLKQVKLPTLEDYYCRVVKEIVFNNNIGQIGMANRRGLQQLGAEGVIVELNHKALGLMDRRPQHGVEVSREKALGRQIGDAHARLRMVLGQGLAEAGGIGVSRVLDRDPPGRRGAE